MQELKKPCSDPVTGPRKRSARSHACCVSSLCLSSVSHTEFRQYRRNRMLTFPPMPCPTALCRSSVIPHPVPVTAVAMPFSSVTANSAGLPVRQFCRIHTMSGHRHVLRRPHRQEWFMISQFSRSTTPEHRHAGRRPPRLLTRQANNRQLPGS